jgi:hypothetical protein
LAFLLTGKRERSLDLATEALDVHGVIPKALADVREELALSKSRLKARETPPVPAGLAQEPTKLQLERALLAMDLFPRCALLLSLFEGISVEDSAVLLDAEPKVVLQGRTAGLWDLFRNLTSLQLQTSTA